MTPRKLHPALLEWLDVGDGPTGPMAYTDATGVHVFPDPETVSDPKLRAAYAAALSGLANYLALMMALERKTAPPDNLLGKRNTAHERPS